MDVTSLSDRQLAGQRLMVGFDGTRLDQDLRFMIDTLNIGGVVLFSRNLIDPDQIRQLTRDIQAYAEDCGLYPLFIAIDQEGGVVARLKPPFTQFPGNPYLKSVADAVGFAETTATELGGVGVNMDLAPVMDVAFDGARSVMADRAFGHDPQWVAHLGKRVIAVLQRQRIMAVAKHFPGIGRTELDSHMDLPTLDIEPDLLMETDIIPFQAAIAGDVAGVMLSHIRYPKIDGTWPASLSGAIAKDMLRNRLGYGGVVMTDDLDMGAIENHFDIDTAIDRILAADIDIAMICHRSPKIETAHQRIRSDIERTGEGRENTIRSVSRIIHLKERYL